MFRNIDIKSYNCPTVEAQTGQNLALYSFIPQQ